MAWRRGPKTGAPTSRRFQKLAARRRLGPTNQQQSEGQAERPTTLKRGKDRCSEGGQAAAGVKEQVYAADIFTLLECVNVSTILKMYSETK